MRNRGALLAVVAVGVCLWAGVSHGYFLDKQRRFDVRLRAYAQLGIMMDDSEQDWQPTGKYEWGDIAQERNFYNPEFDAKLTDFMGPIADDFKFHFAWWGFYDGLYDYANGPWNKNRQNLKARQSQSDSPHSEPFTFNDENKNARRIYGSRNRINELYLDYTKGPIFMRVGRQAISWGESDDVALLDVTNPFDLTMGAPGFFQDTEEARIPLWTARTTVKLIDSWKFLSSFFADTYLVPGPIDTTVPIDPMTGGVSPFTPDVTDAQGTVGAQGNLVHVVQTSRLPKNTWENSRWGARLTGVLARDYTVQSWVFRTFNEQPVPWLLGSGTNGSAFDLGSAGKFTLIDDRGYRTPVCLDATGNPVAVGFGNVGRTRGGRYCSYAAPSVALLDRRLETVFGVAATWFSQPVNGVIRTEAEFFKDELAFIPERNLNPAAQLPKAFAVDKAGKPIFTRNGIPTANYLRWVIGYDRFFFARWLNPSNSFTFVSAFHGQWNTSAGHGKDYRNPVTKPGKPQTEPGRIPGMVACDPYTGTALQKVLCQTVNPKNFEDEYVFDNLFFQFALQTDYLHGRLTPRIVSIIDVSGIFAFAPSVTYRINDSLLANVTYLAIESSRRTGLGTFRGHDMAQIRLTYQLN